MLHRPQASGRLAKEPGLGTGTRARSKVMGPGLAPGPIPQKGPETYLFEGPTLPQKPLPGGRNRHLGPGREVPETQKLKKLTCRNVRPIIRSSLGPHNISSRCGPTLANSDNCTGLLLESRTPCLDRGLPLRFADGAVGGLRAIEIDHAATLDDVFRPAACNLATPCSLACNLATRQPAQPYSLQIAAA